MVDRGTSVSSYDVICSHCSLVLIKIVIYSLQRQIVAANFVGKTFDVFDSGVYVVMKFVTGET